jgi:hypothetical protein
VILRIEDPIPLGRGKALAFPSLVDERRGGALWRWASQGRYRTKLERSLLTALESTCGQLFRLTTPRSPWDPRAVSDPDLIAEQFPGDLVEAGRADRCRRPAQRQHAAVDNDLAVPIKDMLQRAMAAPHAPAAALPGTRKVRWRSSASPLTSDQDQRAVTAIHQTFSTMLAASDIAFLRGMAFLDRFLG